MPAAAAGAEGPEPATALAAQVARAPDQALEANNATLASGRRRRRRPDVQCEGCPPECCGGGCESPDWWPTERENQLALRPSGEDLLRGAWLTDSCEATRDQPFGSKGLPVLITGGGSQDLVMTIRAGRKKSEDSAKAFTSGLSEENMLDTGSIWDSKPAELNFALRGTLTFTYPRLEATLPDFHVGQGSNIKGNNWWIGSKACRLNKSGGFLGCTSEEGYHIKFYTQSRDAIIVRF